jgi:hypothetical protein
MLKGQCPEMDIFFEGLNIVTSTFCVCADDFQGLSKAFHYPIQLGNFLVTFLKLLNNFYNAFSNLSQNSLLCDWSMFSTADILLARKN